MAAKGKKAKKKSEAVKTAADTKASEPVSAEELKRRSDQRELQQLVLRLRKEGASDQEIKKQKLKLMTDLKYTMAERREYWKQKKQENFETKKALGADKKEEEAEKGEKKKAKKKKEKAEAEEEEAEAEEEEAEAEDTRLESEASAANHEVIVIPIVWRGRHDRNDLIKAAEEVKWVLAQQGVDCWVDSRRQYTPGQKFAFWEHKGAKYRIEIGPKDYERGEICVCKHPEKPGDYKNTLKKHVPLPEKGGARDLLVELKKFGLEKLNIVLRKSETQELSVLERGMELDER